MEILCALSGQRQVGGGVSLPYSLLCEWQVRLKWQHHMMTQPGTPSNPVEQNPSPIMFDIEYEQEISLCKLNHSDLEVNLSTQYIICI